MSKMGKSSRSDTTRVIKGDGSTPDIPICLMCSMEIDEERSDMIGSAYRSELPRQFRDSECAICETESIEIDEGRVVSAASKANIKSVADLEIMLEERPKNHGKRVAYGATATICLIVAAAVIYFAIIPNLKEIGMALVVVSGVFVVVYAIGWVIYDLPAVIKLWRAEDEAERKEIIRKEYYEDD